MRWEGKKPVLPGVPHQTTRRRPRVSTPSKPEANNHTAAGTGTAVTTSELLW